MHKSSSILLFWFQKFELVKNKDIFAVQRFENSCAKTYFLRLITLKFNKH